MIDFRVDGEGVPMVDHVDIAMLPTIPGTPGPPLYAGYYRRWSLIIIPMVQPSGMLDQRGMPILCFLFQVRGSVIHEDAKVTNMTMIAAPEHPCHTVGEGLLAIAGILKTALDELWVKIGEHNGQHLADQVAWDERARANRSEETMDVPTYLVGGPGSDEDVTSSEVARA